MTTLTLTFHSDPGHGWLEVPKSLIPPGLARKITPYSYKDDENYYLEEDDDAPPVIRYLSTQYNVNIIEKDYDDDAPIRSIKRV